MTMRDEREIKRERDEEREREREKGERMGSKVKKVDGRRGKSE